jgi:hypothetical protein
MAERLQHRAVKSRRRHRSKGIPLNTRRTLIALFPISAAAALLRGPARAAEPAFVDEKDPSAANLGYVSEATRADRAKYKTYTAGQECGSCQLFQGQVGAAGGPCPLFAGKQVMAKGWCSAYVKKT